MSSAIVRWDEQQYRYFFADKGVLAGHLNVALFYSNQSILSSNPLFISPNIFHDWAGSFRYLMRSSCITLGNLQIFQLFCLQYSSQRYSQFFLEYK